MKISSACSTLKETPLNVLQVALSKAAKDPRIEGLAIKIIDTQMELSQAQEIAALIQKFKASGNGPRPISKAPVKCHLAICPTSSRLRPAMSR